MTFEEKKEVVDKLKAENPNMKKGPFAVLVGRAFNEIKIKDLYNNGSSADEIVETTGIPRVVVNRVLAKCSS